jgi:hypothetical protein
MPPNLIFMATKQPASDPSIGLPLFEQSFQNWGAVGFDDEPLRFASPTRNEKFSPEGYLPIGILDNSSFIDILGCAPCNLFDEPE